MLPRPMLRTTAFRKWTSNLYSHQKCGLSEKGWKGMLAKNDKVVANSGSIARDILAAERTFLAWSRTGLGFVGAGSAMFAAYHRYATSKNDEERFYQQEHIYPASALLVSNGAFLLLFATRRYLRTIHWLMQDKFPVDTRGTLLAILVTATSTVTSLGLVLHSEYNKRINSSSRSSSRQEQERQNIPKPDYPKYKGEKK